MIGPKDFGAWVTPTTRRMVFRAALIFALAAAGAMPAFAEDAKAKVTIDNFTFAPAALTISVGTTVTWENHDDIPHSLVEKNKLFRSKALDTDEFLLVHLHASRDLRLFLRVASAHGREDHRQAVSGGNPTYPSFSVSERRLEPEKLRRAREVRIVRPDREGMTGQAVDEKDKRKLFDEVFLPHLAQAYRLARWLTGNAADAEDVVQEASLRAFRGIAGFGGINARAWTLSVVRNTAYSWLLKNRPAAVVFSEDLDGAEQERLQRAAESEERERPKAICSREPKPRRCGGRLPRCPRLSGRSSSCVNCMNSTIATSPRSPSCRSER